MIDVSIIIPTARPADQFINKVVDRINLQSPAFPFTYEILVIGPEEIKRSNVKWFKESAVDQKGPLPAGDYLLQNHAEGDYVIIGTDDHYFDGDWWEVIDFIDSMPSRDRKMKISSFTGHTRSTGPIAHEDIVKETYPLLRWPVASMDTIKNHLGGVLLDPRFHYIYADNWLSFLVGKKGEPGLEFTGAVMMGVEEDGFHMTEHLWNKYKDSDREMYLKLCREYEE